MADYYVDQGAYSGNLGATPTWGVPQEGDGSTKDAATASSVGSVLFGSVPTSGAFSVCGASVSTTGVLNAATVNAAADALASNINATTNIVSSAAAVGTPQLRNFVYARGPSGGAASGTCQIMMRIGSVTLNYATNSNSAIAHTFDGAPTITQFAGGSGGCWGWFWNAVALGVASSIAIAAYGLAVAKPYVAVSGLPTGIDSVHVRTGRNLSLVMPQNTSLLRGNVGFPLNLIFDSNLIWTGDGTSGVLSVELNASWNQVVYFGPDNSNTYTNPVSWASRKKGGFTLVANLGSSPSYCNLVGNVASCAFRVHNLRFVDKAGNSSGGILRLYTNYNSQAFYRFDSCEFDYSLNTTATLKSNMLLLHNNHGGVLTFDACDFKWSLNGAPFDTVPIINSISPSVHTVLQLRRCRVTTGNASPLPLLTVAMNFRTVFADICIDDCQGISIPSAFLSLQSAIALNSPAILNRSVYQSRDTGRGMRYETRTGIATWEPQAAPAYPYLAALQPDGTPWSIKFIWYNQALVLTPADPFVLPAMSVFYTQTAAIKTFKVELFVPSAVGISSNDIHATATYLDSTGVIRQETNAGLAVASSAASWTNAGSYSGYVAKKIEMTTQYSVKQNTEVTIEVALMRPCGGASNVSLYIDPEVTIS